MERVARAHDVFLGAQLFQFSKTWLPEYPVTEIQTSALLDRPAVSADRKPRQPFSWVTLKKSWRVGVFDTPSAVTGMRKISLGVGELRGRYSELMDGTALQSDCMFADHALPLCVRGCLSYHKISSN